jgi:hypothetical protein
MSGKKENITVCGLPKTFKSNNWGFSIVYSLLIFRPEYLDWKLSHFVSNRLLNQNQSYEFSNPQLLLLKVFGNPHTVIFSFFPDIHNHCRFKWKDILRVFFLHVFVTLF